MNIIVTGGSGYIGGSFIKTFKDGYDFVKFSLLEDALNDLEIDNVDVVLHCAALVHQKTDLDYSKYDEVNVKYPVALAQKAKESGVKQFIFISTIAVYGEDEALLEEDTECTPVTPYGKSKLEAEKQLEALNDESFVVSILRPPMVYGKDAPGNIASLVKLVKKVPVLPFGKIDNKRSFVYIGNLIYMINKVIEQKQDGVFLAADDEPLSTTGLISLIAKALDKKIYLIEIPFFESLLKALKPSFHKRLYESLSIDNRQTKALLSLKNPYTAEQGIEAMIHGEKR